MYQPQSPSTPLTYDDAANILGRSFPSDGWPCSVLHICSPIEYSRSLGQPLRNNMGESEQHDFAPLFMLLEGYSTDKVWDFPTFLIDSIEDASFGSNACRIVRALERFSLPHFLGNVYKRKSATFIRNSFEASKLIASESIHCNRNEVSYLPSLDYQPDGKHPSTLNKHILNTTASNSPISIPYRSLVSGIQS